LHSSQITSTGLNFTGFQNPHADKLISDAEFTLDVEKQNAFRHELQQLLTDELPYSFLYENSYSILILKRFQNVLPIGPFGIDSSTWFTLPGKEKYKDE
jgi:ABC-type transport system substrate-binding protein